MTPQTPASPAPRSGRGGAGLLPDARTTTKESAVSAEQVCEQFTVETDVSASQDHVVATAWKSESPPIWTLRAAEGKRPAPSVMQQYRQAWPRLRVKAFPALEWDALPYGRQDSDWVYLLDGRRVARSVDGVRS